MNTENRLSLKQEKKLYNIIKSLIVLNLVLAIAFVVAMTTINSNQDVDYDLLSDKVSEKMNEQEEIDYELLSDEIVKNIPEEENIDYDKIESMINESQKEQTESIEKAVEDKYEEINKDFGEKFEEMSSYFGGKIKETYGDINDSFKK